MEVKAKLRRLRMAPRKVRVVADEIRGLSVDAAEKKLEGLTKRAAMPVLKLVKSAVANAEHNQKLKKNDLFIKTIRVDEGVTLKRWKPRAFGRAAPIRKRSSQILLVLDVTDEAKQATQVKQVTAKKEKPVKDEIAKKADVKKDSEKEEKIKSETNKKEVNEEDKTTDNSETTNKKS